jgi:hypothetical protein
MPAAIEWTAELEARIAELLANEPLTEICKKYDDLPCRSSINTHLVESDSFWTLCARARKVNALQRLEDTQVMLDSADESTITQVGVKLLELKRGDAKWIAERLLSKDYAPNQRFTGADGEGPVEISVAISEARKRAGIPE